jgi:hypothetical protein
VLYFKKDGIGRGGYILASVLVSAGVVVGMVLMILGPIG